jgi:hypothetical protein
VHHPWRHGHWRPVPAARAHCRSSGAAIAIGRAVLRATAVDGGQHSERAAARRDGEMTKTPRTFASLALMEPTHPLQLPLRGLKFSFFKQHYQLSRARATFPPRF